MVNQKKISLCSGPVRRLNKIISFSGGKDSTAMLLMMLDRGEHIHSIVWFDTGWEFPQMHDHIKRVEDHIGIEIVKLNPERSFHYWMFVRPVKAKNTNEIHRIGCGWPSPSRRWCTRIKVDTLDKHMNQFKPYVKCVGFAADEWWRQNSKCQKKLKRVRYPLIEWGITERQALDYCYSKGFTWQGLYNHFTRVSCFCCPLQRIGELRTLRREFPILWKRMLIMDHLRSSHNKGFKNCKTVHDFERQFKIEDKQLPLFPQSKSHCYK